MPQSSGGQSIRFFPICFSQKVNFLRRKNSLYSWTPSMLEQIQQRLWIQTRNTLFLWKKSKCTQILYPLKMTYWAHFYFLQASLGFLSEADITFHITDTLETENNTSQSKNKQHGGQWRCSMDHQVVHFTTVSLFTGYHSHDNALNQSRKTLWNYFPRVHRPNNQSISKEKQNRTNRWWKQTVTGLYVIVILFLTSFERQDKWKIK